MAGRLRALFQYYANAAEWPEPRRAGRFVVPDDAASRFVLTLGQVIAALASAGTLVGAVVVSALLLLGEWRPDGDGVDPGALWFRFLLAAAVHFVFWLAMFFVFTHVKWVVRLVECQQAVLAKLLDRWDDAAPAAPAVPVVPVPVAPGARPPSAEIVLKIVETRTIVGGWVLLECDAGGQWVPPLDEGLAVELRWPGGKVLSAATAGEERHVRARRPGRVAFTLGGAVTAADVDGATEVKVVPR